MDRLPEGYYLLNFETVLDEVRSRYGDLLHPEEAGWMEAFRTLPQNARRLYVRMLTRKGPWFREDDLHYVEIGDPAEPLSRLVREGFCDGAEAASREDLLPLLTREELAQRLKTLGVPIPRSLRRDELKDRLCEETEEAPLVETLRIALRPIRPRHAGLWSLACFLFFGNGEQDLSSFVLADTGRIRYEAYAIDPEARLFRSREDIDFLLSLRERRDLFEHAAQERDLETMGQVTDSILAMEPHPGVRQQRRFHGLLNDLGRAWERADQWARALACYALSERPPARERTARVKAKEGDETVACRLALAMAAQPRDLGEARFARRFLRRRAQQHPEAARWIETHPVPDPIPEVPLTVPRHPSGSVELAALEEARRQGWEGFFSENFLWNALFGLVFWEELFAPVPGAFQHRFQAAPLDLGGAEFFLHRQGAMERHLEGIRDPAALRQHILGTAEAKWGVANAFLHWRHLTKEHLAEVVERVPPEVIIQCLRTMAVSPRAFDSGFPDLFLYRTGTSEWMLWEVKGPGDTLRPEQEAWLNRFRQAGCRAEVVRVKFLE